MKREYKIAIVVPIIVFTAIFVSYTFFMILNYDKDTQYKSSLPTIEITGFLTDEGNERHTNLKYSIHEGGFGPAIGSRYYLQDKDIDPQLVGEYVRINGYLENDYERNLIKDGFELEERTIVRVIYVKELEITKGPFVP